MLRTNQAQIAILTWSATRIGGHLVASVPAGFAQALQRNRSYMVRRRAPRHHPDFVTRTSSGRISRQRDGRAPGKGRAQSPYRAGPWDGTAHRLLPTNRRNQAIAPYGLVSPALSGGPTALVAIDLLMSHQALTAAEGSAGSHGRKT